MKAIRTKYFGPTLIKGSRVKADDGEGNTLTVPWNYDLDSGANHRVAAMLLCDKMQWKHPTQCGFLGGIGYHTFNNGSAFP